LINISRVALVNQFWHDKVFRDPFFLAFIATAIPRFLANSILNLF